MDVEHHLVPEEGLMRGVHDESKQDNATGAFFDDPILPPETQVAVALVGLCALCRIVRGLACEERTALE